MLSIKAESSTGTAAPAPTQPANSSELPSPLWLLPIAIACLALWLALRKRGTSDLDVQTSTAALPANVSAATTSTLSNEATSSATGGSTKKLKSKTKNKSLAGNASKSKSPTRKSPISNAASTSATADRSPEIATQASSAPNADQLNTTSPSDNSTRSQSNSEATPSKAIFEPLRVIKQTDTSETSTAAAKEKFNSREAEIIRAAAEASKPLGKSGQFVPQKRQTTDINNNTKRWSEVLVQPTLPTNALVQPASLTTMAEEFASSPDNEAADDFPMADGRSGLKNFVSKVRSNKPTSPAE